jgi:hypothetical protein
VGIAIAMLYLLVMAVAGVRELIPGENTEAH